MNRFLSSCVAVAILALLVASLRSTAHAAVDFKTFPDPKVDLKLPDDAGAQVVVLAGGCFWCTEGVFENTPGINDVVSGYAGGSAETAHYERVSDGDTGHAESARVVYDPKKTTYGQVLKVFFAIAHDPTQLNRQGPDVGTQYRSTIFYANEDQKRIAEAYIKQLNDAKVFPSPIVTTLEPLKAFYPAETYHQDFVKKNPTQGYVVQQALPKIHKAQEAAAEILKKAATSKPAP